MTTIRDLIAHLGALYNPADVIALAIWSPDDVLVRAEYRGLTIDRDLACDIIRHMSHHHDAEIGYCWATIDFWLDELGSGGET